MLYSFFIFLYNERKIWYTVHDESVVYQLWRELKLTWQ